ncbi:MAG: choice-of-anchor F family protein, partial [Sulfurovum sp.]|nr:choice-of-anchor F family protein [Sulfurovum sp.]
MKTNIVKMSLVTAMLLSSGAYAGHIIGANPGDTVELETQFGFGGWNLDDVVVSIVSVTDFTTVTGTFEPTDGTYTTMVVGDSFESAISTEAEVRGLLHGKNWPVGEPSGIKIINGDTKTSNGKPENCIMTTSYLAAEDNLPSLTNGYLDAFYDNNVSTTPAPTLCSSPFQTHKRFKVNMLPTTVADVNTSTGGYGKPIDLVFNLDTNDTNASTQRYQVLQKINNYTGLRLDGYRVEVLDASKQPNAGALTLSLGIGEKEPSVGNIWGVEDMANFSHGLWGPATTEDPPHFPEDGFFDSVIAYFPVQLNEFNTTAYTLNGPVQGGNYNDLFGHWLPSKWAPYGIFFDNDNDPTTDAELVAFWGTTPDEASDVNATPAWHKGQAESWAEPTTVELDAWMASNLYSVGIIEDTLNLGLNYIVEVGDNTSDQIGATFTIRITPHVSADQTPPSYIDENGTYILPPGLDDNTTDDNTTDDNTTTNTGGGGGCTYNPNSKNFD